MSDVRRLSFAIGWDINRRPIVDADNQTNRFRRNIINTTERGNRGFKMMNSTVKKLGLAIGGAISFGAITLGFKNMINQASIAEEQTSKFGVVFGELAGQTRKWASETSNAIGRSQLEIEGFLADSQNMLVGFGATREEGAKLSKQIITLGYDLASFNNIADDRAIQNLQSGIMGNHEAVKSLGAVLNESTLSLQMERMGLKGKFQDLDELTKMQVRYETIVSQSTDSIGDAERTSKSYANQLKALKGRIRDAAAELGRELIPEATKIIKTINDNMPEIKWVVKSTIGFSIDMFHKLNDTMEPVIDTAHAIFNVFRGNDLGTFRIEGVTKLREILGPEFGDLIVETIDLIKNELIPAAEKIGTKAFKTIGNSFKFAKENGEILIPVLSGVAAGFLAIKAAGIVATLFSVIAPIAANLGFAIAAVAGGAATLGEGLLFIMGPVGWAIGAFSLLVAGGVALYRNWDTITEKAKELAEKIKPIFKSIGNFISRVFKGITEGIKGFLNTYISDFNFLIGGLNNVNVSVPDWVPKIGGKEFGFNIPKIPMLALGTNNFVGGSAIVGEKGPELVTLPRGSQVTPYSETKDMFRKMISPSNTTNNTKNANIQLEQNINITVNGGNNAQEVAQVTRRELERMFPDLIDEMFATLARKMGYNLAN